MGELEKVVEWLVVAEGQKEGWRRERVVDLASGRTGGGTVERRDSAGRAEDPCVRTGSAGEGSPAANGVRTGRDHADGRGRGLTGHHEKGSRDSFFFLWGFV